MESELITILRDMISIQLISGLIAAISFGILLWGIKDIIEVWGYAKTPFFQPFNWLFGVSLKWMQSQSISSILGVVMFIVTSPFWGIQLLLWLLAMVFINVYASILTLCVVADIVISLGFAGFVGKSMSASMVGMAVSGIVGIIISLLIKRLKNKILAKIAAV